MNILVIGSGGREHAIIKKLLQSEKNPTIFCTPGNGGIAKDATCLECDILDSNEVCKVASKIKADLVVVAPDDPLAKGVVDALNEKGFKTFGPNKAAAIIESSKAFSKDLMKKYNIPTAKYETFTNFEKAIEYIELNNVYPIVIKADGLALGKGVIIAENFENAKNAVDSMMNNKCFGESGNTVVIEEFLTGPEVSVLSFCDGKTVVPMISSMDHKRALDDDKGLNTGGMGTIAPNPYYTEEIANFCEKEIFQKTVNAMISEGRPFKGCLYFGLMLTKNGPK
ncbi:MAG: phosphoribosylamine--glycine ligase, partial [Oscillospiraceae bacterium]